MDAERIGLFIAELRREKGLTQRQLAERLHVSFKAVSRWETGRGMPDIENLEALSSELGVGVTELLSGERIIEPVPAHEADSLTVDTITLLRAMWRRREFANAALSFLAGLVVITVITIYLTSPSTIPYHEGIVSIESTEDGTLLASIEEGVVGCDINYFTDSDTGDTIALVCCYSKLFSRILGTNDFGWHMPGVRYVMALGTEDTVDKVYYYPGTTDWPRCSPLYSNGKTPDFDAITQPCVFHSEWICAIAAVGVIGLALTAFLHKRWFARHILLGAFLPICLAVSMGIVLWGKLDQSYNVSFYASGISSLTLALYALFCLVISRVWQRNLSNGAARAQEPIVARAVVITAFCLTAVSIGISLVFSNTHHDFQHRTVFVPTEGYVRAHGYPVNASGQTYGPDAIEGYGNWPDLVLVEGVDDVIGYVSTDDLGINYEPSTPEEAIAYQESHSNDRIIPVYDRDGTTVLGWFRVG